MCNPHERLMMKRFVRDYIAGAYPTLGNVLDVGSMEINGSHRPIWPGWRYVGVDIAPGQGVDIVVSATCRWKLGELFDVVFTSSTLEHVKRPWVLIETMGQHMKAGGLLYLCAPYIFGIHRYPIDCWRFCPDGLTEFLLMAGCEALASGLTADPAGHVYCHATGRKA